MSTHCVFKTRMLVSAAACAPDNRALNKTSSATVSFFIDHVYANFSSTKITFPTRINGKTRKQLTVKKSGYTVCEIIINQ